jgi:hypothetical protein
MKKIKDIITNIKGSPLTTNEEQCNIDIISNWFYCEIESNPAQETCKEQCKHCKKEWEEMNAD